MSNMNGGIRDLGSIDMANGQKQGGKSGKGNSNVLILILAVAVVLILGIVVFFMVRGSGKDEVEDAIMAWEERGDEIEWEKYYPDEIADAWEDRIKEAKYDGKSMDAKYKDIEIASIVKLKGDKAMDVMEDVVTATIDEMGADLRKREVDIEEGYMVAFYAEHEGELYMFGVLVIKVNGRYGIYDYH